MCVASMRARMIAVERSLEVSRSALQAVLHGRGRPLLICQFWQEVCARDRSPFWAYITGELSVSPTILHLALFMSYIDQSM